MAFSHAGFAGFRYAASAGPYDAVSRRAALDRLDMLATAFDTAFIVPGTNIRFGVESLMRLVPGIGDVAASALSFYSCCTRQSRLWRARSFCWRAWRPT